MHLRPTLLAGRPRRGILALAGPAAVLGAVSLTACVGGVEPSGDTSVPLGEDATLTVVSQFGDNAALQPVLQEISGLWEQGHPEVNVDIQFLSAEDQQKTLPTSLSSGSGPDVFDYDAAEGALGVLAANGLVRPLDEYAGEYGWLDRLPESMIERITYDGAFYAVPRSSEAVGLFYNADILTDHGIAEPDDYASFIAAADALRDADITPVAFGNKDQWPSSHLVGAAIHALVPVDEINAFESLDAEGHWSATQVREAFEITYGWVESGYLTPNFNGVSFDDAFKSFMNGEAGMFIEGTGVTPDLIANTPAGEIRFISFPMIDEKLEQQAQGGVGGSWAISSSSPVADIAADWIDFVHFSEEAERIWLEAGVLPTTDYSTDGVELAPLLRESVEVVQDALDGGGLGQWTGYTSSPLVTDAWNGGGQRFLAGEIDADAFTASLDEALDEARNSTS
ncbi:carbohydrate ABC transporter substrate-binding protein [Phytoactinopolyspora alkaliphila]|uniref:Carbohydrate ABC transporter substrate-binding protein n=1 Tax=Phytoactinopolyspora alkaliphila TaxID=1783498 RepID=A0A6N9YPH4_9ACTN|nr:ABC transporter substrate-binding protein [Phytoactinopolyspora alkaliphila]NED96874.1 carbohydrate ABC transporter substrate-binding protein [Phytoactinopolyspora alkaliphila]